MPNAKCYRCNGIAYATRAVHPGSSTLGVKTVTEEVRLCTICRSKADRENRAAKKRGA
jgi:hypothetical protein